MSNQARSITAALEQVKAWKTEETEKHSAELAEVDQEVESLKAAVANLEQQLGALSKFRDELVVKGENMPLVETTKTYEAIFGVLNVQAEDVTARAAKVQEANDARAAALKESLQDPELAGIVAEVESFDRNAVEALPESYRAPVLAHHESRVAKLREHFAKVASGPVEIEADQLTADLVFAVDMPEGRPELLIVVLPVSDEVQTAWTSRPEDLETHVAARAVQAVYTACKACNLGHAQAMFGGHKGLLAVEVDLVGASADLPDKLAAAFGQILTEAPELVAAKLSVTASPVTVDQLLPPEPDEVYEDVESEQEATHAG